MKFLRFLWTWGRRIPTGFCVSFVVMLAVYLVILAWLVHLGLGDAVANFLPRAASWLGLPEFLMGYEIFRLFWSALVTVSLLLAGVLLAYNGSVPLYRRFRKRPAVSVHDPAPLSPGTGKGLDGFERIGIILAGGGAKGAYQAGAMKAIHEFLEQNNALDKVGMIAGTSIGSWNAMFWLADLIKAPDPEKPSAHEQWWRSIDLGRIIEFDHYLPLWHNHFVRSTPWQEIFEKIFIEPTLVRERLSRLTEFSQEATLHFYFTRSNVERGHLEFSTNWAGLADLKRPNLRTSKAHDLEPMVSRDLYEIIRDADAHKALGRMKDAVFASMDLPPLFPYTAIKTDMEEWFEDGGVVDNLPVWFGTQIERCDLLFVLPLNASFAEPVNQHAVTRRLFRVMDVRQGVLERNSFKLAYLYNELAELKGRVGDMPDVTGQGAADRALKRTHKPISIFAICPAQPLAIGTAEFWKATEAGRAFELMYAQTKYELEEHFEEDTNPNWIRMTVVSPLGERSHFDDF